MNINLEKRERDGLLLTMSTDNLGFYTLRRGTVVFSNANDRMMIVRSNGSLSVITNVSYDGECVYGSIGECLALFANDMDGIINGMVELRRRLNVAVDNLKVSKAKHSGGVVEQ